MNETCDVISTQKRLNWINILFSRRLLVTFLLGFSSGLPLSLTASTLQAWYTVSGINIVAIGALSLVGQPYVYKWGWSPLLDRYQSPFLGRWRDWIIVMQLLLVVTIVYLAFLDPRINPVWMAIVAFFVAIFSATQDIAIDAYRTDLLKPEERGAGSAMVTGGYRIAMLVSGGLAMALAKEFGWRATFLLMALMLLVNVLVTLWSPRLVEDRAASKRIKFWEPMVEFLSRRYALMILLFIVLYKIGDAFTLSLSTAFLLRGLGFSLLDVGAIYKVVGMSSVMLGAFIGGVLMIRMSLYRALFHFGILQTVSNLAFMALAIVGKSYAMMVSCIFIESFCGGLASVAFGAFIMSLCDKRYTATHFALLSAFAVAGRVYVGPVAGVLQSHVGWIWFFWYAFLVGLPGLVLLVWLRQRLDFSAPNIRASTTVH